MAYVYRHIRLDTQTPFYVGKGNGTRAWSNNRNPYWKNIANSVGYRVEIIWADLSEEEAFSRELQITALYKKFGFCETNLGLGGKLGGPLGIKRSLAHRQAISKAQKGATKSYETCKKISKAKQGGKHHMARPVLCLETGKKYDCGAEAAKILGLLQCHILNVCHGKRKSHGGLTFKFYEKAG